MTETAVSVSYSTVSDIPSRPTVALQKEDQRKAYLKQEMPDPLRMLWILAPWLHWPARPSLSSPSRKNITSHDQGCRALQCDLRLQSNFNRTYAELSGVLSILSMNQEVASITCSDGRGNIQIL